MQSQSLLFTQQPRPPLSSPLLIDTDTYMEELEHEQGLPESQPQILSPCSSGRRSNDSNSPEFEFWNVMRNPNSFPDESNLLSADELFSDGVLLPLDRLHVSSEPDRKPEPEPNVVGIKSTAAAPALTSSKRWRDIIIFRKNATNNADGIEKASLSSTVKESNKKREPEKSSNGGGVAKAAELNINIWPFSRSRSAGNGGARPRPAASGGGRKVSSAPCSRSNSGGDSKTRRWPSSPGRLNGVHLGRTSPVWQVRRGGAASKSGGDKLVKKDGMVEVRRSNNSSAAGGAGKRVLSLNVPMCIGYRSRLSCRSDKDSAVGVAVSAVGGDAGGGGDAVVDGEGVRGGNIFGFRSLFNKKVY